MDGSKNRVSRSCSPYPEEQTACQDRGLYQNDDYGKGYLKPLKDALSGQTDAVVVAEASYEVSDPTVDSQIITLKSSGADTLLTFASPKFAALSIRKVYDIGWRPHHMVAMPGSSVASVLKVAGLERSTGLNDSFVPQGPY